MNITIEYDTEDEMFFINYGGETAWGITEAQVLVEFAKILDPYLFSK